MTDADEFTEFVAARWAELTRAAYLWGLARQDAEDAAQASLLSAYRNWAKIQRAQSPEAYVFKTLLNNVRRTHRRNNRRRSLEGTITPASAPDASPGVAARVDFRTALAQLPWDQRAVIVLRHLEDRSERDVAELLDLPLGTVKSRNSRGLQRLAGILDVATDQEVGS